MEVPHHGHGGKKNWKGYAVDFIMLFLAVFSGFVAENLREHYVEKERAHQYIGSMLNDLDKDTANLQHTIDLNNLRVNGIDSFLQVLHQDLSDSSIKRIYYLSRYIVRSDTYEPAGTTITQLKNAGGYRLITDTGIVNRIMSYDQQNEYIREQGNVYSSITLKLLDQMTELMDLAPAGTANARTFYFEKSADKRRMFYNKCFIQQKIIASYVLMLEEQKKAAVKNIDLLRKKI